MTDTKVIFILAGPTDAENEIGLHHRKTGEFAKNQVMSSIREVCELKTELGPCKSAIAARRTMGTLKCKPNQSTRELLKVLKKAFSLAGENPDFESHEFFQLFYEALSNKIKVVVEWDYYTKNGLGWLIESTIIFTVLQNSRKPQD